MDGIVSVSRFVVYLVFLQYLPAEGLFDLFHLKYSGWQRLLIGIVTGIAVSLLLTFGFGLVHARTMSVGILIALSLYAIIRLDNWLPRLFTDWGGPHLFLLVAAFLYSLTVFTSGWRLSGQYVVKGANSLDGVWNIALIRELEHVFPPGHPSIAGEPLRGYHFLYNLWVADIGVVTGIDATSLYFHYVALLLSLLLVYSLYFLAKTITADDFSAKWCIFFALAGGSASYILRFFTDRSLSFDDAFGITQPFSLLISPSFVLSCIVFAVFLVFMIEFVQHSRKELGILLSLFAGILVGIKVYAFFFAIPIFLIGGVYDTARNKNITLFIYFILAVLVALFVFLPTNENYGYLVYFPLWPLQQLMEGNLSFSNWELKRQTYTEAGNIFGVIRLYIFAFVVFLFGNLGTRSVAIVLILRKGLQGFFQSVGSRLIVVIAAISFVIPLFFYSTDRCL